MLPKHSFGVWWGLILCGYVLLAARQVGAQDPDVNVQLAAMQQIAATEQSLCAFLLKYQRELEANRDSDKVVKCLGSDVYAVREDATWRLIDGPLIPLQALQRASLATDLELASRAKQVLNHPNFALKLAEAERQAELFEAVCRMLPEMPIAGVTKNLFAILPLLERPAMVDACGEAVAAVTTPADAEFIRLQLASKLPNVKLAAIRGAGRSEALSANELRSLFDVRQPRMALAATQTLAELGDRAALGQLLQLLVTKDEFVRVRSEQILRAWTGQQFGLNPFLEPTEQLAQRERWQAWMEGEGRTGQLLLPIRLRPLTEDLERGLLLHYTFDQIMDGKVLDQSIHKRHATINNAHQLIDGVANKALHLEGTGEMGDQGGHVELPFIDFTTIPEFTFAMWVKERGMSEEHGEAYIVFGADRLAGIEDSVGISHFNDNIVYRIGEASIYKDYVAADRDRWVHFALTFGAGTLRAYRNGKLAGETVGKVAIIFKKAALGRHWWHHGEATSTRFQGALDELRIYERALPAAQIELLHSAMQPK